MQIKNPDSGSRCSVFSQKSKNKNEQNYLKYKIAYENLFLQKPIAITPRQVKLVQETSYMETEDLDGCLKETELIQQHGHQRSLMTER